jgi:uncharacterized protein DUF11
MLHRRIVAGVWMFASVTCATAGVNTWTEAGPQGGEVREVAMHPVDPDIAVAIAFSGVYRTTSGGATWTKSDQQFQNPPYDLKVDPDDPNRLYVFSFSSSHIVVSSDGGVTFQPLGNLPVQNAVEARLGLAAGGVMYYSAGLRVFRSENRGASWTERTAILADQGARIRSIVVDRADTNTVYAMAGADAAAIAMFVSRDGATTWTHLADYALNHAGAVVPHPVNSGEVWAGRFDGLWRSTDYGATWTNVRFAGPVYDIALTVPGAALHVAVVGHEGVFQSTNGGASWTEITGDLTLAPRTIAAHPTAADRIMVSGLDGVRVLDGSSGAWLTRHQGIVAGQVGSFEADPTTDRIYALVGGGVHASASGAEFLPGNNEQLATIGSLPPPTLLTAIHAQPGNLLALLSNELARSTDGGATWTLIPGYPADRQDQLWQLESARADPLNLIVVGTRGAYRSSNGGGSWARITAGLPADYSAYDLELAESNLSVVYLSPYLLGSIIGQPPQSFGVYRSNDGGTSWVAANAGIEALGAYDIEIDPTDAQIVYAIAGTTLVKSTDGGATWRTLRQGLTSSARIAIDPNTPRVVYVVYAENQILRSVNGGELFEMLRTATTFPWWFSRTVVVDPRRPSVVNVGTGGFGVQQMSIEPDLALAWSTTPTTAAVGSAASYFLSVTNRGPYASSGARVTIQFPAGATGIAALTQRGSCTVQQTNAVCVLSPLVVNASAGISLTATPQAAGSFAAQAGVEGDQPDANGANNAAAHSVEASAPIPPAPPPAASGGGGGGGGDGTTLLLLVCATLLLQAKFSRYARCPL